MKKLLYYLLIPVVIVACSRSLLEKKDHITVVYVASLDKDNKVLAQTQMSIFKNLQPDETIHIDFAVDDLDKTNQFAVMRSEDGGVTFKQVMMLFPDNKLSYSITL